MDNRPFDDLFADLDDGQLPLSYLYIARLPRKSLPELTKRDRQAAYSPRHQCHNLPIVGPDVTHNSVWWAGDELK
jgi:hypothetical protein